MHFDDNGCDDGVTSSTGKSEGTGVYLGIIVILESYVSLLYENIEKEKFTCKILKQKSVIVTHNSNNILNMFTCN